MTHLIQHLNYIVDPSNVATPDYDPPSGGGGGGGGPGVTGGPNPNGLGNGPVPGSDYDPRDPNHLVRHGGTGIAFTKKRKNSSKITYVQSQQIVNSTSTVVLSFDSDVALGNLILVFLNSAHPSGNTVTDSLGNVYAKIVNVAANSINNLEGWYTISGSSAPCTITATDTNGGGVVADLEIIEFEGATNVPNYGTSTSAIASPSDSNVDTGTLTVVVANELVIGYIVIVGASVQDLSASPGFLHPRFRILYNPSVSVNTDVTGTQSGTLPWAGVGIAWRPA